jgi:hypothetical protein
MNGYVLLDGASRNTPQDTFGQRFFSQQFMDWMRAVCVIEAQTPVLELVLTSGERLDIALIVELQHDYLVVDVFDADDRSCQHTHRVYLRYGTIYRIAVYQRAISERPIGFNVQARPHIPLEPFPLLGKGEREAEPAGAGI